MAAKPYLQSVGNQTFIGEPDQPPTAPAAPTASTTPPLDSGSAGGAPPKGGDGSGTRPNQRARAEKNLPTDRLGFDKQIEALRAIAQLSGTAKRPVTAEAISSALGLKGNTGGLSNKFFRDNGWIEPAGRGEYIAADSLVNFGRHLGMDSNDLDGARKYLAATARENWHWQEIADRLHGQGLPTSAVLHALAKAAGASAEHRQQLELVIDWLGWLGLVRREDDKVMAVTPEHDSRAAEAPTPDESARDVQHATEAVAESEEPAPAQREAELTPVLDGALVSMNFSVRITADDATKLSDDQLRTLLDFAEKMRGK